MNKVENILKRVAASEGVLNYEIILDKEVQKGDGFLSEFYTGKVRNKDTGDLIETYIKLSHYVHPEIEVDAYNNEYNFYSRIYPEIEKFQKSRCVEAPFDKIPKYYCGGNTPGNEYLALENLKVKNYVLYDKTKFIDETHLKLLFETYGKYHALTFAFKDQKSGEYEELVRPLKFIFPKILIEKWFPFTKAIQMAQAVIREDDEHKAAKLTPIIGNIEEFISRGLKYDGKYSTLVHGDCWSNNMMFKYNDKGEIENLKLVDHQMVYDSTPVHDLSYFFYSGASKSDFDKLDEYLELYYQSFSSFARELGSDPEKLFPFDALKCDWKKYSFLGINMGLMVWLLKFMSKEKIRSLNEDNSVEFFHETSEKLLKNETFKRNISNILLHAIEYGII